MRRERSTQTSAQPHGMVVKIPPTARRLEQRRSEYVNVFRERLIVFYCRRSHNLNTTIARAFQGNCPRHATRASRRASYGRACPRAGRVYDERLRLAGDVVTNDDVGAA